MSTKHSTGTPRSPVPGVTSQPVGVEHAQPGEQPARRDPGAEREARRNARDERRGPQPPRSGVMIPNRRRRLPLEAPLMRLVATAGIVGIAVVVAVIMGSQNSEVWLIGLATSVTSLVLAALLWSSRRL